MTPPDPNLQAADASLAGNLQIRRYHGSTHVWIRVACSSEPFHARADGEDIYIYRCESSSRHPRLPSINPSSEVNPSAEYDDFKTLKGHLPNGYVSSSVPPRSERSQPGFSLQ